MSFSVWWASEGERDTSIKSVWVQNWPKTLSRIFYDPHQSHRLGPYLTCVVVVVFRQEEAAHQEAPERLHVVHEGDEGEGGCGVYAEGERGHQPNTRQAGESLLHLYQIDQD